MSPHPVVRFLRRRLARGVPYGLGFTLAFVAVVGAVWGFVEVVDAVADADDLARWDEAAHDVLYDTFGASRDGGRFVTWFGNSNTIVGLVVAVVLGLGLRRMYWAAFRVVFASGVGGAVIYGLKAFFARQRPVEQVIEATGYSFPSGHAFASTVFYGMMIYLTWRLTERRGLRALAAVVFTLMVVAVGLSRVYLNVHFLTDVVAGWLGGVAWLVASLLLVDVVETRFRSRAETAEERTRPDDADPQPHPG